MEQDVEALLSAEESEHAQGPPPLPNVAIPVISARRRSQAGTPTRVQRPQSWGPELPDDPIEATQSERRFTEETQIRGITDRSRSRSRSLRAQQGSFSSRNSTSTEDDTFSPSPSRSRSRSRHIGSNDVGLDEREARRIARERELSAQNPYSTFPPDYCPPRWSYALAGNLNPEPAQDRRSYEPQNESTPVEMEVERDQMHSLSFDVRDQLPRIGSLGYATASWDAFTIWSGVICLSAFTVTR